MNQSMNSATVPPTGEALIPALADVRKAIANGAMTFTELQGSGAILMLSERDEMLTINVSAAWLIAELQAQELPLSTPQLVQRFAEHFAITEAQAMGDMANFLVYLAKQLR